MAFRSRILTSVSTDHLDYHGDLDSYRRVKEDFLAEGDDLSVVNADDAVGGRVAKRKRRTVAFSCSRSDADLFAEETGGSAVDEGLKLEARHRGGDRFRLDVPGVPGGFLAENVLAAVLTALENGIDVSTIRRALEKFSLPRGRMNRIDGPRGIAVYIDYAHTPDALEKVLRCLRPKAAGRLRVVFGCGGNRDRTKRPVMGRIAGTLADAVYLTADNSRFEQTGAILDEIREGIPDAPEVFVIPDRGRAISRAVADCGEGDVVLIAGKGHETYQEIEGVRRPWSDFDRANRALFGERKEGCA
jgi:UDP-N-acetylmuramoyl-L-alanyl-D-glutamate--2,6-diaminopimelate ligase